MSDFEIGNLRPEGRPDPILGPGSTERRGPAEALELVSFRVLVWHAMPPGTGAADPRGLRHSADPLFVESFGGAKVAREREPESTLGTKIVRKIAGVGVALAGVADA